MTGQLWYPGADTTSQRFDTAYAGIKWEGPAEKDCLHTTETTGFPAYGGGKSAPNFTGKPNFSKKIIEWRQHFPANMSARALQNDSGGVETNKDKVIQIELCGTCDGTSGGAHDDWSRDGIQHIFTPEAPDWWLEEVAKLIRWTNQEHGVQLVAPSLWLPYDDSYGNSKARMSGSTYNSFRGVLGHMHVAENDHGDPGAINITKILSYAKGEEEDDDMKAADLISFNGTAASIAGKTEGATMRYEDAVAYQVSFAQVTYELSRNMNTSLSEIANAMRNVGQALGQLAQQNAQIVEILERLEQNASPVE